MALSWNASTTKPPPTPGSITSTRMRFRCTSFSVQYQIPNPRFNPLLIYILMGLIDRHGFKPNLNVEAIAHAFMLFSQVCLSEPLELAARFIVRLRLNFN
jgi:hypothetical protein